MSFPARDIISVRAIQAALVIVLKADAANFWAGLIDDIRILRLRSGQVLQPGDNAIGQRRLTKKIQNILDMSWVKIVKC